MSSASRSTSPITIDHRRGPSRAMTAVQSPATLDGRAGELAQLMVGWLGTGDRPDGMLADDVLADLTIPLWRIQAQGPDAVFRLREDSHPCRGDVRVEALDRTARGFLMQFEERWDADGQRWYSRELIHCVMRDGRISELTIYRTGDWDAATQQRHVEQVHLVRP